MSKKVYKHWWNNPNITRDYILKNLSHFDDAMEEHAKPKLVTFYLMEAIDYAKVHKGEDRDRYFNWIQKRIDKLKSSKRAEEFKKKISQLEDYLGRSRKSKGLTAKLGIVAIAGLGIGLFFYSNISGNVISNLNQNSSSTIIGAILIILGLLGAYFYFKK